MIRLIGPGGAGKSTIGELLAERLNVAFLDLDRHFNGRFGDIGEYIGRHGYDAYAQANVETYYSLVRAQAVPCVVALSSGFMTYARDIHPEYSRACREIEQSPTTFVLIPALERDVCPGTEEAVIRARFEIYMGVPARKIETMRPVAAAVDEIIASLPSSQMVVERTP